MTEERKPGLLDRVVDGVARALDAAGLDGRKLRWTWERKRREWAEAGARSELMLRSARGRHKMCPACRALVAKSAAACPECGEPLRSVSAPSAGRLVTNLLPGVSAATSLIMLANGFWFAMMLMAQIKAGGVGGLGLVSGFDPEIIVRFGSGLSLPYRLSDGTVTGGEWWRIVTPIFLHGSILHFFFNSYFLLNLGPLVEETFGTERFWVAYLTCGIAGSWASQMRPVNTVGASGAIMGMIGLLLVYGLRNRSALGEAMKRLVWRLAAFFIIVSLLAGGAARIDHLNHLGGFVCGALLGWVLPGRAGRGERDSAVWGVLSLVGVLVVLLCFYKVATLQ